jgi:hypothetical protein
MSILDPRFKYVPAASTDIRKTFAKARRAIAEQQKREAANQAEQAAKVRRLAK